MVRLAFPLSRTPNVVQERTERMTRLPTQDEIPNTTDGLDQAEHLLVRFGMRHDHWSGNNTSQQNTDWDRHIKRLETFCNDVEVGRTTASQDELI